MIKGTYEAREKRSQDAKERRRIQHIEKVNERNRKLNLLRHPVKTITEQVVTAPIKKSFINKLFPWKKK